MNTQPVINLLAQHPWLWVVAGAGGLVTSIATANKIFDGCAGFLEALRFWFQPNWLSLLRKEFWDDFKAELKLFVWVIGSALVVLLLKIALTKVAVFFASAEWFKS